MFRLALWFISRTMKKDADLAWSWHCNVAMVANDAGATHHRADIEAANFMRRAFGVDTYSRLKVYGKIPPGPPSPPRPRHHHPVG